MREIDPSQRLIDDANARLIAAAPELLAALKECVAWVEQVVGPKALDVRPWTISRAAIAKAEGR